MTRDRTVLLTNKYTGAPLDILRGAVPEDYTALGIENAILTPHIGGVAADSFGAMMRDAFRNIECFENNRLTEIGPYRYL